MLLWPVVDREVVYSKNDKQIVNSTIRRVRNKKISYFNGARQIVLATKNARRQESTDAESYSVAELSPGAHENSDGKTKEENGIN